MALRATPAAAQPCSAEAKHDTLIKGNTTMAKPVEGSGDASTSVDELGSTQNAAPVSDGQTPTAGVALLDTLVSQPGPLSRTTAKDAIGPQSSARVPAETIQAPDAGLL